MKYKKRHVAHVWLLMPFWRVFSCLLILTSILLPLAPLYASEETSDSGNEDSISSDNAPSISESESNEEHKSDQIVTTEPKSSENHDSLSPALDESTLPLQDPVTESDQSTSDGIDQPSNLDEETSIDSQTELETDTTAEESDDTANTPTDIDISGQQSTSSPLDDVSEAQDGDEYATTTDSTIDHESELGPITPDEISTTSVTDLEDSPPENDQVDTESEVPLTTIAINDENFYAFAKNECTTMGNGSFYCMDSISTTAPKIYSGIYVSSDNDGDKEIFALVDGVETQITSNTYDDDAPYFDSISNTIVFHRQIEGRYQIVSYDFETGLETMITTDRFNNMQPYRHEDTTVWQAWIGNDWEIMMLREGGEIQMLTDNNAQDVTPSVNDTHVVWQSKVNDVWEMHIYNMHTKTREVVHNTDSSSIQNPRFVLVYDSRTPEGDVETRGYDLKSGKIVDLGAETPKLPTKIPDPEQTGEDRALILASQQLKKGESDDQDPIDSGDGDDPDILNGTESASGTSTSTSTDELMILEQESSENELMINKDLIVPPQDIAVERELPQDLVIPPYEEVVVPQSTQLEIVPLD